MAEIGKLSIRVFPDTSRFREELKKTVERATQNLKGKVEVELDVDRTSIVRMRKLIKSLREVIELDLDADTGAAQRKINNLKDTLEATVNADADTGAAEGKLKWLTRIRKATVKVDLDGLATARASLAALAGANIFRGLRSSVTELATNLDTFALKAGVGATKIAALSSVALSAVGSLASLGASLASMAPAALILPGAMASASVGLGVLIAALKDTKEVLGDLGPSFGALQDQISGAFWERAAGPIREMVSTLLPAISGSLAEVSHQFGGWAVAISGAISSAEGISSIQSVIESTRDAVDIAGDGVGAFTSGLLQLSSVGASYMPALAGAFNDMAFRFEAWITSAYETGAIFSWVDHALGQIKLLGSAISSFAGILGAVAQAASAAGGGGLAALAGALAAIEQIVTGPAFQAALTTVFQGAFAGVQALLPGIQALGGAFQVLAPTISQAMATAGEVVSLALQGIAQALANPAVSQGINALFDGMLVAVQALQPAFAALGPVIGALAGVMGQLLATIAPIVAQLATGLAPILEMLLPVLTPIIQLIGTLLLAALSALLPILQMIVTVALPPAAGYLRPASPCHCLNHPPN